MTKTPEYQAEHKKLNDGSLQCDAHVETGNQVVAGHHPEKSTVIREQAMAVFMAMRAKAAAVGYMTDEEIEAEIRLARSQP